MRLKNVLLVVADLEKSKAFYKELLGMEVVRDFDTNVILSGGLVLQKEQEWETLIGQKADYNSNTQELYFVCPDIEAFQAKLDGSNISITYLHRLMVYEWGQKAIRFYDPDGHLIEVGET